MSKRDIESLLEKRNQRKRKEKDNVKKLFITSQLPEAPNPL